MTLPLTLWQLHADALPDRLADASVPRAFALPGAQALSGFADLLGGDDNCGIAEESAPPSVPFSLPAMLPQDVCGAVSLRREIDFGALGGDRALLELDHIAGRGRILLGETVLCAFDSARFTADMLSDAFKKSVRPCMLCVDLTSALSSGRRETLAIEFDDVRPAGLPGPVMLHVTQHAHLSSLHLIPNPREQSLSVRAQIHAARAGRYALRAQAISPDGIAGDARESAFSLSAEEDRAVSFSFPHSAAAFAPGSGYEPSAVKVQLYWRPEGVRGNGMLCDDAALLCGYSGKAPGAWLPVHSAALLADPQGTLDAVRALHVPAVSLDAPAPDSIYRLLCRAAVAARLTMPKDHPLHAGLLRLPNLTLTDTPQPDVPLSLEASAWQLCSMTSTPRALDETLTPRELLLEASGLPLDPGDGGVQDVLQWLRAVSVRLRAEAARQGRFEGALCACGEWENPDAARALQTAFAPMHLSALPLCGAWWTTSRFSASLQAFIPAGSHTGGAPLTACAVLEDSEGHVLARVSAPCPAHGGYIGLIEAALPSDPCVLELTCRLLEGDIVIEESTLPVYVGERGPLEAAFSPSQA